MNINRLTAAWIWDIMGSLARCPVALFKTLTAGIVTGGGGTPDTINALYDGTTWTVSPQSRPIGGSQPPKGEVGTQGSHLVVAVPSPTTATLEWVSGSNVVTISSS